MSQLYVIKGTLATFNIVVARNGAPVNLTGAGLKFVAHQNSPSGPVALQKSIGSGIVVTSAAAGQATLTITGADSSALLVEQSFLYFELLLDEGSGDEVVDEGTLQITVDTTPWLYITVADVRALGLDSTVASDSAVLAAIKTWQKFIERACRQWFYPLELEMNLDGTDSDALHFGVPIISIASLRINNATATLDPKYYRVYNNLLSPADRQNPRLKLVDGSTGNWDIYTAPLRDGRLMFRHGRQNQYVKGVFGYIEADGTTPELIKRALAKLVVEKLTKPIYANPLAPPVAPPPLFSGVIVEEWTDGHKIKYGQSGGELKPRQAGLAGITDDPEVLGILKLYKAPIGLATPSNPSFR